MEDILITLIISFIIVCGSLSVYMLKMVLNVREERNKISKLSASLYEEFKRIRGSEWSKKQLSDIVNKIVSDNRSHTKRVKSA